MAYTTNLATQVNNYYKKHIPSHVVFTDASVVDPTKRARLFCTRCSCMFYFDLERHVPDEIFAWLEQHQHSEIKTPTDVEGILTAIDNVENKLIGRTISVESAGRIQERLEAILLALEAGTDSIAGE